ncbi:MAG TPA: hypothetical protein VGN36_05280 [Sphingorhabdus sp.]|jgi:hypothetical protein|nr:hypothetical protein [Sphingorhabdus sp.]
MRLPEFEIDGWCLDDGEEYHQAAPETFWIPDLADREQLQPGDLVKLIFRIAVDDPEDDVAVERMWVIVRERVAGGYLGILDNEPSSIDENDDFWLGTELPFQPRHVINIDTPNEASIKQALEVPVRRWA